MDGQQQDVRAADLSPLLGTARQSFFFERVSQDTGTKRPRFIPATNIPFQSSTSGQRPHLKNLAVCNVPHVEAHSSGLWRLFQGGPYRRDAHFYRSGEEGRGLFTSPATSVGP